MGHKILILLACVLFGFTPIPLKSTEIHAIILVDTCDGTIGAQLENNLVMVSELFNNLSRTTEIPLHLYTFTGYDLAPENLFETIEQLSVEADDTVIFYFAGHGYRTYLKDEQNNQWPNLYMGPYSVAVDFFDVTQRLREKNPRFLLAITESCNSYLSYETAPPMVKELPKLANIAKNFRKLFIETRGVIMMSSSIPGEYSWIYPNGGAFTLEFTRNLNNALFYGAEVGWGKILNKTRRNIKIQTLQYIIEQERIH